MDNFMDELRIANNYSKKFMICENTMGFSPDICEFDTLQEAVDEIQRNADYYANLKDLHSKLYPSQVDNLNFDETSWKYSERWTIERRGKLLKTIYINRVHFADGTAQITLDDYPKYGNYRI